MHVFDEVTEKIEIIQHIVRVSDQFNESQTYDLVKMLEEVLIKVSDIDAWG